MISASKKARNGAATKEEDDGESEDRLSDLPDCLIHHIFSYMDTKYAVRTSVLSTRFRHLSISLPHLNFDNKAFRRLSSFTKFVSQFLSRRDGSNISTLGFARRGSVEPWLLKRVIKYAVSHNVQLLNIDVSFYRHPSSLTRLFNCQSLTTLHLSRVSFAGHESKCSEPFSECLNLKNLTLIDCSTRGLDVFTIFSPQLANLYISYSSCWPAQGCKFVVSAPKLASLHLRGFPLLEWSVDDLPFLERVELDAYSRYYPLKSPSEREQMLVALRHLLPQLRNAKFVTLSSLTIEILSLVPSLLEHLPSPFGNLKSLRLRTTTTIPDHVETYLLSCSPGVVVEYF